MSALVVATHPRAIRFIQLGLWLLSLWNLARAFALWQQAAWRTDLPLTPDPRLRLALALAWAAIFAGAAWRLRVLGSGRLIPLLLAAFGVLELSMITRFASWPPAVPPILAFAAFTGFAGWSLWRSPVRALFPSRPRSKEVADRRTL